MRRIIDWENGGYCRIHPVDDYRVSRRYVPDTMVLETVYTTETGEVRMLDCMTMRAGGEHSPHRQILRVLQGVGGRMKLSVDIAPVFDYGEVKPWIRKCDAHFIALGSSNGLLISGGQPLGMRHRHHLEGVWEVAADRRAHLSILWRRPEDLDDNLVSPPDAEELEHRRDLARKIFQRVLGTGNDLGIYSEEYDPQTGEMLGNFPQALTHLSLIAAAVAIEKAGG